MTVLNALKNAATAAAVANSTSATSKATTASSSARLLAHKDEFLKVYPQITSSLISDLQNTYEAPPMQLNYINNMINYNIKGGKMLRGLMVRASYSQIKGVQLGLKSDERGFYNDVPLSEKECKNADIVGWCLEWMQSCFLMADDVIDQSVTRRGKPCWYKVKGVGLKAINDALILEMMMYRIINVNLPDEIYKHDILSFLMDITYHTELGQLMDLQLSGDSQDHDALKLDGNQEITEDKVFDENLYQYLVIKKTAYYSFYAPVALAMKMALIKDPESYKAARDILLPMGEYFQIQDDYLDCYGDVATTGKVGTDIQDGKCSWLIIQAMKHATDSQKEILLKNYGKHDVNSINKVKEIYNEIGLEQIFHDYESKAIKSITDLMTSIKEIPSSVFIMFLETIVGRKM